MFRDTTVDENDLSEIRNKLKKAEDENEMLLNRRRKRGAELSFSGLGPLRGPPHMVRDADPTPKY